MKQNLVILLCLIAGLNFSHAQTAVLYQEDWGTTNGAANATTLASVGWSQILLPSGADGMYEYGAPYDVNNNSTLPLNILYVGGNAGLGMFYTTSGAGAGTYGDTAFTSINPSLYTNLQFSVESQWSYQGQDMTCWLAVQVGGTWYVATNQSLTTTVHGSGNGFAAASTTYNPQATNWNVLTISPAMAIGAQASGSLSGTIDGIGIVTSLSNSSYWDFNLLQITSISNTVATPPSLIAVTTNQTVFQGGGVSFAVQASGSQPFTYQWYDNGVPLTNSAVIVGATTNEVTIKNVTSANAGVYSVKVSNSASNFNTSVSAPATLTVSNVPSDYLYAETFPFVGPLNAGYSLSVVDWGNAVAVGTDDRLDSVGGGAGDFYAGDPGSTTAAFYTDTNLDVGTSGLPFPVINPASYPAVSFSVDLAPDYTPADISAYFAVQMNGSNWYASATAIPIGTSATTTFSTYRQQFQTTSAAWNTLTINANGAVIGGVAPANLSGNITGAGMVVVDTGGGYMNVENFLVVTDATAGIPATINSTYSSPYNQTVYAGAGVSFAVAASGTQPLSYFWQSNNVTMTDGGGISGSTSNVLTILNTPLSDNGVQYSCIVSNSAGTDNSAYYVTTTLTVNTPPSGLLYAEEFPFIGPSTASEPLSEVGWASAIPDFPDRLFQIIYGEGTGYSYEGGAATTALYTTTSLDNGGSGLPFPAINLGFYPSLTFSVDIAPDFQPTNVTAYLAVQMNGNNWYVSSTNLPVNTSTTTATTSTYTQTFSSTATNWDNLTLGVTNATIGSVATGNLSGTITGAGLVFVDTGTGGTFDFDNFLITGTGIGGVTVNSRNSTSISLSWIGASNVSLQSATNLSPPVVWSNVPNTTGQNSATIPFSGSQRLFFRLVQQ